MKNVLLFGIILLLTQCKNEKIKDPCACTQDFCTEEYRMLTVKVKDSLGHPVALDDYFTVHLSNSDTFRIDAWDSHYDSINKAEGIYPILSDSYLETSDKCYEEFQFTGIKNNAEVAKKTYKIKNNCCHVEWAETYTDIISSN